MSAAKRYTRQDRMQPADFEALCKSVYGPYWRRSASLALGRDAKMMARYATGDAVVPEEVAERHLTIAETGLAAELVKGVLLEHSGASVGTTPSGGVKRGIHKRTHDAAIEIVELLGQAGLLKDVEE